MERQKGDPEFYQLDLRVHHWGTHKPINQVKQGNCRRLKKEDLGSGFEFNLEHWRRNRKMRKEKRQSDFALSEQDFCPRKFSDHLQGPAVYLSLFLSNFQSI